MHLLYDGTFDGLLTTIFYGYQETGTVAIYKAAYYEVTLIAESRFIVSEPDKATRVYESICSKLSSNTLKNIYYTYLSDLDESETLILKYLKLCYRYTDSINLAKNNPIIHNVDLTVRRVHLEAHRFTGFVRFKELYPMVFYAQIAPVHAILPLILSHFEKRFSDQSFMIHDVKRNEMILYNKKQAFIQKLTAEESNTLRHLKTSDAFETLFKAYYHAATISERLNLRQRNSYMPKRYFKHLPEL